MVAAVHPAPGEGPGPPDGYHQVRDTPIPTITSRLLLSDRAARHRTSTLMVGVAAPSAFAVRPARFLS